jgi:hypothetical protein
MCGRFTQLFTWSELIAVHNLTNAPILRATWINWAERYTASGNDLLSR